MPVSNKKESRRRFISTVSKTGLLGAIGMGPISSMANEVKALAAYPAEGHVFLTQPYLQAPATDGITIMWITNKLCYSWVEYGEGDSTGIKVHQLTDGLVNANNRINCVRLHGLKPGTRYSYKVFSKEITDFQPYKLTYGDTISSDVLSFQTINPEAQTVSWLVMNDIHDRPKSIPHLLQLNGNDPYDFVFFNGDMFDYQTDEQQIIDHMLKPCTDTFASTTPFLFVRGNHETRGKYARQLVDYFASTSGKYYFSFNRGPVYMIVLDTGEDKLDTHPVYAGIIDFDAYRIEQLAWLEKEMQTKAFKKAKFRVVMMHIPHHHSDEEHGTTHCRQLFGPLFDKHKIDLFIAGHTHKYGVYNPTEGKHSYPFIIGGGPKEGNRTLIKIKADQKTLRLQMLLDDGKEVGSYVINSKR